MQVDLVDCVDQVGITNFFVNYEKPLVGSFTLSVSLLVQLQYEPRIIKVTHNNDVYSGQSMIA